MAVESHFIHNTRTGETLQVVSLPSMGINSDWEEITQDRAKRLWADALEAAKLAEALAAAPPPETPPVGEDDLTGVGGNGEADTPT